MRKLNLYLLLAVLFVGAFTPDVAEARRRVRRGVGASNFVGVNRLGRFGLFNRSFFPFFGFGLGFGFNRPVVIPFEANAINPFNPFGTGFSGDILGSGHDVGPQGFTPQASQQQTPTPATNTPSQARPVADTAPAAAQTTFSDHNPNDLQQILANAVRSVGAQSTGGEWSQELCSINENYAAKMAAQGSQDKHAGFKGGRANIAMATTGGSAEEITSQGSGSPEQAAQGCVALWQGSPDHVGSLMRYHKKFCYSMARSNNGNYYCVGLFAN